MRDPGHRFSSLDQYETSGEFSQREKTALRYTDVIVWDPTSADDALWEQLHAEFTEAEIVELGYWIGFTSGGQRWLQTLNARHGELAAAIAENENGQSQESRD